MAGYYEKKMDGNMHGGECAHPCRHKKIIFKCFLTHLFSGHKNCLSEHKAFWKSPWVNYFFVVNFWWIIFIDVFQEQSGFCLRHWWWTFWIIYLIFDVSLWCLFQGGTLFEGELNFWRELNWCAMKYAHFGLKSL